MSEANSQPAGASAALPGSAVPPAPPSIADEAAFARALDTLAAHDPKFMDLVEAACGCRPALRRRDPGFEGLAAIVVSQQVSTASANAIFARVSAHFPTLDAAAVLAATDDDLRLCGLSAPKIRTLRAVAVAVDTGLVDLAGLARLEADVAHSGLCAIKGIGPWTADIFLLFCLGHADAWPAGDLALQEGTRLVLGLETRPSTKELMVLGDRWRPLRGVAAHCLWAYYGAARSRATTLEDTASKPPRRAKTPVSKFKPAPRPARTRRITR